MCEMLGVSTTGYYSWRNRKASETSRRNKEITTKVKSIYEGSQKIYGSPKVSKELNKALKRDGLPTVSERTVTRIMKREGWKSKTVKKIKATTNSKHTHPVYPNHLQQQFDVVAPGVVWVADIPTFGPMRAGYI